MMQRVRAKALDYFSQVAALTRRNESRSTAAVAYSQRAAVALYFRGCEYITRTTNAGEEEGSRRGHRHVTHALRNRVAVVLCLSTADFDKR